MSIEKKNQPNRKKIISVVYDTTIMPNTNIIIVLYNIILYIG